MPHTQEYYLFKGKFSIASSPLQLTRYPPPKISEKDDYWENQRIELWNELDEKTRTTFSWPSRGDTPRANFIPLETVSEQVAMDNFCLLIYKITEVEHLDHSTFPPKRMVNYMYYKTSFKPIHFKFYSSIFSLPNPICGKWTRLILETIKINTV
jgi:hypothetical protein